MRRESGVVTLREFHSWPTKDLQCGSEDRGRRDAICAAALASSHRTCSKFIEQFVSRALFKIPLDLPISECRDRLIFLWSIDPANDQGFSYACLEKASLSSSAVWTSLVVVIFAAAFSSYADMIQLWSEHESWRILLRIRQSPELVSLRPRIRRPKDSLFHSQQGLI